MAPVIPFMTEHIWQKLVRQTEKLEAESIMLSNFPKSNHIGCEKLLEQTSKVRDVIYLAQKLRAEHQIKVKQPLAKMILKATPDYVEAVENFKQIILDELNIKDIEFADDSNQFNDKSLVLNFRKAGAVLKGAVNNLKQKLAESNAQDMAKYVLAVENGSGVEIDGFGSLDAELFEIKLEPKKEFAIAHIGNNLVVLDIELDESLIAEGKLRELVRELQVARKEADFNIDDRICLNLSTQDAEINQIISQNLENINAEVLCVSNDKIQNGFEKTIKIDGKDVVVKMQKHN